MIEPEMAFCDLQGDMDLAEEFIKAMARYALEHCAEDLAFFAKFVDKGLRERLKFVVERPFVRVPYTEAVEILKKSGKQFEFPVELRAEPAIRTRAVPHRGAFQIAGDRLQLPARDQTVLHAAERRRQDRHRDGRAGAGHRRSHRRRATRGAARPTAREHEVPQAQAGGLLVVCGPAAVRHRAARGLRPGLRAVADVPHRRVEHPRRDPLRAHAGEWLRALAAGAEPEFKFIVVNDTHYMSEACGVYLAGLVKQMNGEKPAFVLHAGDVTDKGELAHLKAARRVFRGLDCAFHPVMGNHDWLTPTDRKAYLATFPLKLNYSFRHAGWQFIGLDTTEGQKFEKTKIQPETFEMLDDILGRLNRTKPTVVFTHFPLCENVKMRPLNAEDLLTVSARDGTCARCSTGITTRSPNASAMVRR